MKKELRKELLQLLYSLGLREVYGNGEDISAEIAYVFNMIKLLTDKETAKEIVSMWETRNDGLEEIVWAPASNEFYDAKMYRLMKFDREVRCLLSEKKYI